jgi:hypothetical protein
LILQKILIMTEDKNIECPTDLLLTDEVKARLTAAFVFILTVLYSIFGIWIIPAFLVIDFFSRGFNFGRFSLLSMASDKLSLTLRLKPKLIDQAPKRFAARLGFLFSLCVLLFNLLQFYTSSLTIALLLASFALLESALGLCAGCHVYAMYNRIAKKGV